MQSLLTLPKVLVERLTTTKNGHYYLVTDKIELEADLNFKFRFNLKLNFNTYKKITALLRQTQ